MRDEIASPLFLLAPERYYQNNMRYMFAHGVPDAIAACRKQDLRGNAVTHIGDVQHGFLYKRAENQSVRENGAGEFSQVCVGYFQFLVAVHPELDVPFPILDDSVGVERIGGIHTELNVSARA